MDIYHPIATYPNAAFGGRTSYVIALTNAGSSKETAFIVQTCGGNAGTVTAPSVIG